MGFLSGYRRVVFSLCCSCFCIIFLDYLLSELSDKQRHLAGNFRGVSGRLCWIFKFCLRFFLVSAGVSFQFGNLLLRTGRNFDSGIFCPEHIFLCFLCFCFDFDFVKI